MDRRVGMDVLTGEWAGSISVDEQMSEWMGVVGEYFP